MSSGRSSFGVHTPLGRLPGENTLPRDEGELAGDRGTNGADLGERRHCGLCSSELGALEVSGLEHCLA